jgi:hypothetical protein
MSVGPVECFESPGVGSIEIGANLWKDYEVGVLRGGFADVLCHFCQRLCSAVRIISRHGTVTDKRYGGVAADISSSLSPVCPRVDGSG